jgi:hypothetical protein
LRRFPRISREVPKVCEVFPSPAIVLHSACMASAVRLKISGATIMTGDFNASALSLKSFSAALCCSRVFMGVAGPFDRHRFQPRSRPRRLCRFAESDPAIKEGPHSSGAYFRIARPWRKSPTCVGRVTTGGEGGIRTPGTLLEYGALAKRCFRPLSHLSFKLCGAISSVLPDEARFFSLDWPENGQFCGSKGEESARGES